MSVQIETSVLLAHLAATGMMVGIIWYVQLVHYPLFARAGVHGFGWYAAAHARWTAWVVGPPMLVEAVTGVMLIRWRPDGIPLVATLVGLLAIVLLWASTLLIQSPYHQQLARGWDESVHRRLSTSNWIRTLLWSARGVLLLWMLLQIL